MTENYSFSTSRKERIAFGTYLRTGRKVIFSDDTDLEIKSNPWHDPETGRFTFKGQGKYYTRGGAALADKNSEKLNRNQRNLQTSDTQKTKSDNKINKIQGNESKYIPYLSETHNKIIQLSEKYPPQEGTREWTVRDFSEWQIDKNVMRNNEEYLFDFKRQWVRGYRNAIKAAASQFDIPKELLAGVAFTEVGGDPLEADSLAYSLRGTQKRDKTSFGNMSIQFRRGLEILGYDESRDPTESQRRRILSSLKDPQASIFIAAKHISDLRDVDSKGTTASKMNRKQIEIIGARYNWGPDLPISEIEKDLSYGKSITKRWRELRDLLQ